MQIQIQERGLCVPVCNCVCRIFILAVYVIHKDMKCMLGLNQKLSEGTTDLSALVPYCHRFGGFKSTIICFLSFEGQ